METEVKQLKLHISRLCWYMRGGLTLNEAYQLSPEDRTLMYKVVEENIENVKKTKMPLL
tara:strand:- start:243 stop:419 length:177 start_codon:yes stop_codon:yes gene_type:complete